MSIAILVAVRGAGLLRRAATIPLAKLVIRACRICPSPFILHRLERTLDSQIRVVNAALIDWDAVTRESEPTEIAKGIILKPKISSREKGVLLIAFEGHWLRLFRYADIAKLAQDYHLVLGPSWSPPHDLAFLLAAKRWPGRLFTLLSNFNDSATYRRIAPNCEPVPLLASSWVHPKIFDVTEPVPKAFDMVVLANFAAYKRHFLLFRAMRNMRRTSEVLLLGKPMSGRTAATIMAEARLYGVADRVIMMPGLPDDEMIRALRSARVSLMLSGNEGSCVAVVESLFAAVPVGLFEDAVIGSKAFINEQTGRLLTTRGLARQLEAFIDESERYSPRRWALNHDLSCLGSSRVLNKAIRRKALEWGEEWTTDIAAHHWRPNPAYVFEEDLERMTPAYSEFNDRYGCTLVQRAVDGAAVREPAAR